MEVGFGTHVAGHSLSSSFPTIPTGGHTKKRKNNLKHDGNEAQDKNAFDVCTDVNLQFRTQKRQGGVETIKKL